MSDDNQKPKPKLAIVAPDALDLSDLWLDTGLGDGITDEVRHSIPFGKPKDYFRLHPDPGYRRKVEIYRHKTEDAIDEEYFVFAGNMQGTLEEAAPYTLAVCIYRDGTPRVWPLRLPKEGERDNEAWASARAAAKASLTKWVKLIWKGRAFVTREAKPGYAPEPAWEKVPPFEELMIKAVGEKNIIRDSSHPMYRNLIGDKSEVGDGGDDL
jgi:hypothetical protein